MPPFSQRSAENATSTRLVQKSGSRRTSPSTLRLASCASSSGLIDGHMRTHVAQTSESHRRTWATTCFGKNGDIKSGAAVKSDRCAARAYFETNFCTSI